MAENFTDLLMILLHDANSAAKCIVLKYIVLNYIVLNYIVLKYGGVACFKFAAAAVLQSAPAYRFLNWLAPNRMSLALSSVSGLRWSANTVTPFCTAGRAAISSNQRLT